MQRSSNAFTQGSRFFLKITNLFKSVDEECQNIQSFYLGMTHSSLGKDALEKVPRHKNEPAQKTNNVCFPDKFKILFIFSFNVEFGMWFVEQPFIHQHGSHSMSILTMTFWIHFCVRWLTIQSR